MATTSYQDIFKAIMDRLNVNTNWDKTAVPIHWQGQPFNPPTSGLYLQPRVHFADASQVTIGTTGQNRINGALEATIHSKLGPDPKSLFAYCDTIRNLFARGLGVLAGARMIIFGTPEVDLYVEDEDGVSIRVVCPFYLDELQP